MNTKLYLSDLPNTATYQQIMDLFSAYGNVTEVYLSVDRATGRPLGSGLVTMATPEGARAAMQALHGKSLGTSVLTISEAAPLAKREAANVGQKTWR